MDLNCRGRGADKFWGAHCLPACVRAPSRVGEACPERSRSGAPPKRSSLIPTPKFVIARARSPAPEAGALPIQHAGVIRGINSCLFVCRAVEGGWLNPTYEEKAPRGFHSRRSFVTCLFISELAKLIPNRDLSSLSFVD